jgi:hypothetical protein
MLDEAHVIKQPNSKGVAISEKYWLNNESYAVTNDALHKVNDSTTVKWNFNYINELSKIESVLSSEFLTNNQSSNVVTRNRNQLNIMRFNVLVTQDMLIETYIILSKNFYCCDSFHLPH